MFNQTFSFAKTTLTWLPMEHEWDPTTELPFLEELAPCWHVMASLKYNLPKEAKAALVYDAWSGSFSHGAGLHVRRCPGQDFLV